MVSSSFDEPLVFESAAVGARGGDVPLVGGGGLGWVGEREFRKSRSDCIVFGACQSSFVLLYTK